MRPSSLWQSIRGRSPPLLLPRSLNDLSSTPVVEIISLRQYQGRYVFVRLAHLSGLSHIRLLSGDFVGCAVKDDMNIPHLVNWQSGQTYPLDDSPDLNVSLFCIEVILWLIYVTGRSSCHISPGRRPHRRQTAQYQAIYDAVR